MKRTMAFLAGAVAAACAALPTTAYAWGPEGHAIVADIAEAHLDPKAQAEVARLLALDENGPKRHLDQVSSWPDAIRSARPETGVYHYVDIPLEAAGYDESRDCHLGRDRPRVPETTCVVAKLPYYIHVLRDHSRSDAERLEALKWVVHLTGDIHQPLHDEDDHDKGGNGVTLAYNGINTNLHAVWDLGIIERHYGWQLGPDYRFDHDAVRTKAMELDRQIAEGQDKAWAPSDLGAHIDRAAADWANEGHALAKDVYAKLPAERSPGWDARYQDYAWPVVQQQLQKGGVRLAAILNQSLD